MNKLNLILAAILLLAACEYDPSGYNLVELTPPEPTIPIEISLNNVNPLDTLYVYQNTYISINLSSPKDLKQAVVLLDGYKYEEMWSNSLKFNINPELLNEGMHTLTVKATFTSGSGSLAEMMGLEAYMGELSWKIHILRIPSDGYKNGYRANGDGYLEIFWQNVFPKELVKNITVHSGSYLNIVDTLTDVSENTFVDYGYVCGDASYDIKSHLKDGNSFSQRVFLTKPVPKVYVEELDMNNLRVYWEKPFANGRFDLLDHKDRLISAHNDTTITIPQIFGNSRQFLLQTRPQKAEYDNSRNKYESWTDKFSQGSSWNYIPSEESFVYDLKDNILYSRNYNNLVAFNATSLEQINSISIIGDPWGFAHGGTIATAPHNSTVAAMTSMETRIFADSRFNNPIIISLLWGNNYTRTSALTSDDRFFVVSGDSMICSIFNALTGEKLFEIPFNYIPTYNFSRFATVSEDGKYFCASSDKGMEIFEISGTSANLIYTDSRYYRSAIFLPSEPGKIIFRVDTDIEIRQMPGFNLIQKIDVSAKGAVLCNIDPQSNNLLYHQNDSLKVCNVNNLSAPLFKIRSDVKTAKLYNNRIFTFSGSYIDIKPYL